MSYSIPEPLILNKNAGFCDPDELYLRLKSAINPTTGIIKYIYPIPLYPSDPEFFKYSTIVCSANRFSGLAPNSQVSGGAGITPTLGKLAAIGEAFERYCSAIYDENSLIRATFKQLSKMFPAENILQPDQLELFDPAQYGKKDFSFVPFHEDLETFWTWTYCLIQNRHILTPAALVYLPYLFRSKEENFTYNTSTGMAFSNCLEGAILGGIYEVVERDAVMITWYNRVSQPKIDMEDVPSHIGDYLSRRFRLFRTSRVHCMDVTTDIGIPVLFTVITGDGSDMEPALAVGAACRLSPIECFQKSVMEAFQTYAWARYLKRERTIEKDELGEFRVGGFDRHVQYYTKQENYEKAYFSFCSEKKRKIGTIPNLDRGSIYENIETAVKKIREAGLSHVLVKDITSEDVNEMDGKVARVVIPKTVPLNLGIQRRFLAVKRIYQVPYKMGWTSHPSSKECLNPAPHPFP